MNQPLQRTPKEIAYNLQQMLGGNNTFNSVMNEYLNFIDSVKKWDDYKYVVTSLAEEAMEFQQATKVTKVLRGDKPTVDAEAIKKELGDVFFFWTAACEEYGFDAWEVINANLLKLVDRNARGVIQGSGDNR